MAKPIWENKVPCPPLQAGNVIEIGDHGYCYLVTVSNNNLFLVQIKPKVLLVQEFLTQEDYKLVKIDKFCVWGPPIQKVWNSLEDFYGYAK